MSDAHRMNSSKDSAWHRVLPAAGMPALVGMTLLWQVWLLLLASGIAAVDDDVAGLRLVQWIRESNGTVRPGAALAAARLHLAIYLLACCGHRTSTRWPGWCGAQWYKTDSLLCSQADVTVSAVPGTDGLRGVLAARDFASGDVVVSFPLKRAVGLGMATQTAQVTH